MKKLSKTFKRPRNSSHRARCRAEQSKKERMEYMRTMTQKLRLVIVSVLFLIIFILFSLKMIEMQVVRGAEYANLANLQVNKMQTVSAARGEIVDRYGRPMAINRTGFNVVFDRAFLPSGKENETILKLMEILSEAGESWIDNLPMSYSNPVAFDGSDSDIARLKRAVEVNTAANAGDVWYWLEEIYDLEGFTPEQQRRLAGVRYEMAQRGFSVTTQYTFAEDVSIATITKIKEHSFELVGVDVQESTIREYVSGSIAPHVVGRTGPIFAEEMEKYKELGYSANEIVGKEGIEQAMENELRGENGKRQITFQNGVTVGAVETKPARPGNTVVLTLDSKLQKVAQDAIEKQIKTMQTDLVNYKPGEGHEAKVGGVVAIDPRNGEVLVMASYPGYDLSTYKQNYSENVNNPLLPFFNRALNGMYAPGSTFKPVVSTAGLNEEVIKRDTRVTCERVYTRWQDYQPTCLGFHGSVNVITALQHSCNIFFYETGYQLGIGKIDQYAKMYGLGEPTGIELREEVGHRASKEYNKLINKDWNEGDVVQAAIGQDENRFSLLQLANYTATIANRGERMKAHIVKNVVSYNFDETVREATPEVVGTVPTKDNSVFDTVIDGMIAAAGPGGTSLGMFNNYPVTVAAKTGTPQTSPTTQNSVYICFAPVEDPQIAIAVIIEDGWHGYTGVPVAKAIMDQYFFANTEAQRPQEEQIILN